MNEKVLWFLRGAVAGLVLLGIIWSTVATIDKLKSDRKLDEYRAAIAGFKEANSRLGIAYRGIENANRELKKQLEARRKIIGDIDATVARLGIATGGAVETIDRIIEAIRNLRAILAYSEK